MAQMIVSTTVQIQQDLIAAVVSLDTDSMRMGNLVQVIEAQQELDIYNHKKHLINAA